MVNDMVNDFINRLFRPHFIIGSVDNPYLLRWYLIPRNRWFNIYLHKFIRDDDDRALHDHPWWFVSFLIWGRYDEVITDDGIKAIYRNAPSVAYRPAEHRHRVVLPRIISVDDIGELYEYRKPAWTIVITGRKVREWGFWCPNGFVPWHKFVSHTDGGNVGLGCGENEEKLTK